MLSSVICPETEEVELVEGIDSPLGVLITSCSRVRPPCRLACERACASQLRRSSTERDTDVNIELPAAPGRAATSSEDAPPPESAGSGR
jgi:hypothetical protein